MYFLFLVRLVCKISHDSNLCKMLYAFCKMSARDTNIIKQPQAPFNKEEVGVTLWAVFKRQKRRRSHATANSVVSMQENLSTKTRRRESKGKAEKVRKTCASLHTHALYYRHTDNQHINARAQTDTQTKQQTLTLRHTQTSTYICTDRVTHRQTTHTHW
jgi:hypothetical protein